MLDILNVKDNTEREDRKDAGPEAEIAGPHVFVVFNLKRGLDCGRGNERSQRNLYGAHVSLS